jgi:hypothetical protein
VALRASYPEVTPCASCIRCVLPAFRKAGMDRQLISRIGNRLTAEAAGWLAAYSSG